jgi:O-succinylbenzoate synthase
MLESAVGACHCIALATLSNIGYPADIFPSNRFYRKDLSAPEIELSAPGRIRALPGPGIGCVPDRGELERLVVESHRLG